MGKKNIDLCKYNYLVYVCSEYHDRTFRIGMLKLRIFINTKEVYG